MKNLLSDFYAALLNLGIVIAVSLGIGRFLKFLQLK